MEEEVTGPGSGWRGTRVHISGIAGAGGQVTRAGGQAAVAPAPSPAHHSPAIIPPPLTLLLLKSILLGQKEKE